jgi:hypothetical protein
MRGMTSPDPSDPAPQTPLPPSAIEIHAVQFVGTNVEMTYLVEASPDAAAARLDALLQAKLGLYALTRTGAEGDRTRFSVMASPLERLFHKIGPSVPLTLIKHASVTLDLSETNLDRQAQGLARGYPGPGVDDADGVDEVGGADGASETGAAAQVWRPWDAGKLLGTLLRRPALLDHGEVRVAGVAVERGAFPHAVLPTLDTHVEAHGGVAVTVPDGLRTALAD